MATALSSILPKPQHQLHTSPPISSSSSSTPTATTTKETNSTTTLVTKGIPPYRHRKGFVPRCPEDFGDGGAFPEILMAQYPLEMGRKKKSATAGNTLALQTDAQGNVLYDALAKHGHGENKIIKSQFKDLVPLNERADVGKVDFSRPDEEEVAATTERTRAALEKIVNGKITAAKPKAINGGSATNKAPSYIRYTPGQQGEGFNSGAQQRIIRMVEMPVDPLDPPKFKHKKVPKGPPSPPAPVLHSPPRKVSAKEQQEWVIPPCISNWKNAKGYTIPLDKRLAADGRGLQEVQINDNFAKFAEALYAADRHARDEVRQRNLMQQKLAAKEKAAKEENLRLLAQRAREERAGIAPTAAPAAPSLAATGTNDIPVASRSRGRATSPAESPRRRSRSRSTRSDSEPDYSDRESSRGGGGDRRRSEAEAEAERRKRERDEIRRDRQKQREREIRMSRMGNEAKAKHAARETDRSISEKIALGIAKPTIIKDSMFDQRLFNQSEGISSGFKDDEAYTVYDKALFTSAAASSAIYRPKRGGGEVSDMGTEDDVNKLLSQDRFGNDMTVRRGFQGADMGGGGGRRDGPVAFEKQNPEFDPFGHDEFLNQAKKGKRGLDRSTTTSTTTGDSENKRSRND